MANIANLLTEHMDIWTAADTERKSGRGRASGHAGSVYGVKKLRELILELAVRGKLVSQDPNDEPACKLLKRIQAEKAKLIAEGKLKKEKPLAPIGEDEKPFELPLGWEWVRVGDCLNQISNGYTGSQSKNITEFPLTRIETISKAEIDMSKVGYCQNITNDEIEKYKLFHGDILMSHINSDFHLGKTAIYESNNLLIHGTNLLLLRPSENVSYRYLHTCLTHKRLSGYFLGIAQHAIGQSSVNQAKVSHTLMALPALKEQHRIVTKVDELMALCDQLEQQHSNAQEAHETLVSQLIATLTQSQNAAEFNANWQRIYANFDVLFTTVASIDALKQALLQLAVMGKLVPQDPNDEPASELLKRIQTEKTKLIAEGKLKKEKPFAPIGEDEKPFELPNKWEWARLSTISSMKGGFAFPSSSFSEQGDYQVLKMGNIKPGQIRLKDKPAYVDEATAKLAIEAKLDLNDVVITMTGTVGKRDYVYSARVTDTDILGGALFINQRLCAVKPYIASSVFLDKAMKNDRLMDEIFASATGTANQANISMAALANWLLPLPPLAEQHRIVAKVDALMVLCDQLKTRIEQSNQQQQAIADALAEQAVA